MKIFNKAHASARFIEVSFDFSPIYMTGIGAKRRKELKNEGLVFEAREFFCK